VRAKAGNGPRSASTRKDAAARVACDAPDGLWREAGKGAQPAAWRALTIYSP